MTADTLVGGRAASHDALMRVLDNHQLLSAALDETAARIADDREKRLARELAFGVMRWLPQLQAILAMLLDRPLKKKDRDVEVILLLGLYQLQYMRIPPHASVAESVSMARALGKSWCTGLVNAVLRRFQRERDALLERMRRDESAEFAHPGWMINEFRRAWPQHWRAVLEAGNQHAPMTLRVNARKSTRSDYLAALDTAGFAADPAPFTDSGITLRPPTDVTVLPGFSSGALSVQDAAAQLAAPLMALSPSLRVLDACAAPGGKTAHMLEHEPNLAELVALDVAADRVTRLQDNLSRLDLACTVMQADASLPNEWWNGEPFDRILLDAPCTATGVIRRHPDVKFHRRSEDVSRLVKIQSTLLDALWPLLARGGLLLYATCSILPRENRQQIARFLERRKDAEIRRIEAAWGRSDDLGRQILSGEHEMDGFYYALLAKH